MKRSTNCCITATRFHFPPVIILVILMAMLLSPKATLAGSFSGPIYVNDNTTSGDVFTTAIGSNSNSGTSSAPFADLDYAFSQAQPGDTIFVDAGFYAGNDFVIDKPVTFLGANYLISPINPADRYQMNPARQAESEVVNTFIRIESSFVEIKGFSFSPQQKTGFYSIPEGIWSDIRFSKNILFISGDNEGMRLRGVQSQTGSGNFEITDNYYKALDQQDSYALILEWISSARVYNNTFSGSASLTGDGGFLGLSYSGTQSEPGDTLFCAGNFFDTCYSSIELQAPGYTIVDSNIGRRSDYAISGYLFGEHQSPFIGIFRNHFTGIRGATALNIAEDANSSGIAGMDIVNNFFEMDASGPYKDFGVIKVIYSSPVYHGPLNILQNTITITGDYDGTAGNYAGIQIGEGIEYATISENELIFEASGAASTPDLTSFPPVNTGIYIQTGSDVDLPVFQGTVLVTSNLISGFENSVGLYNPFAQPDENGLEYYGHLLGEVFINENKFENDILSLDFGNDPPVMNITCNWYGTFREDSVRYKIRTGNLQDASNFIPWLISGEDDMSDMPGFQPLPNACAGQSPDVQDIDSYAIDCNHPDGGMIEVACFAGVPPYSYTWTREGDPTFIAYTARIENLPPDIYTVVAVDSIGSTSTTSIEIPLYEPITGTVTIATEVSCAGQSDGKAYVTVSGGTESYIYEWSNGSTSDTAEFLPAGRYYVTVTDGNNCSYTDSVDISEPEILSVSMSATPASCFGSASATVNGGTEPYTYIWSNGAVTESITGVPRGTYSVVISDANNCSVSGSITINGNSSINPTVTVTPATCFGAQTGVITVTAANGIPPYQYSINGSVYQVSNVFSGLSAGSYTIAVQDSTGCVDFVTRTVGQPSQIVIIVDSVRPACASVNNGFIHITPSGGNTGKTYSWTGPSGFTAISQDINALFAGTYSVMITDSKGCTASAVILVPEWPAVNISEVVTPVSCRTGNNGAILVTVTGGTGSSFNYSWTGPLGFTSNAKDISGLTAGNYRLTVTDLGSGCSVLKIISVTQPAAALNMTTSKTNATGCNSLGTITANGTGGTAPYQYSIDGVNFQATGFFNGLYAGSYTLFIRDANNCANSKTVAITDNGSDEFEGNNVKNQAKPIVIGNAVNARIAVMTDLADWFRFTTPTVAGNFILSLTHPAATFTFNLYTAGTNTPALIPVSTTPETKEYTLAANTVYYISVTGGLSYVCYQMAINPSGLIVKNSAIDAVVKNPTKLAAIAYPNPHQGQFTLMIESPLETEAKVELFTPDGKLIVTKNVKLYPGKGNTVPFSNIRQEMLFYRVVTDKQVVTGKIAGTR